MLEPYFDLVFFPLFLTLEVHQKKFQKKSEKTHSSGLYSLSFLFLAILFSKLTDEFGKISTKWYSTKKIK